MSAWIAPHVGLWPRTTGCKPANAAPTVRPQKPDSVIGLSMTLLSPNRSSKPFVTLYLFAGVSKSSAQDIGVAIGARDFQIQC